MERLLTALIGVVLCVNVHAEDMTLWSATNDLKYELGGLVGAITYLGVKEWDWGSSGFQFNNEGWFGQDTGSAGTDKLGHMYSSYLMNEFLFYRLHGKTNNRVDSANYSAGMTWGMMMFVEAFDGVSGDHGFSYEDVVMNTAGIAVSHVRNLYPDVAEKFDFRIEYYPSGEKDGFHPVTDYLGMKYFAVLKPAGFSSLKDTYLKYIDFHVGYTADDYYQPDQRKFWRRDLYVGVGLNLSEIFRLKKSNPIRKVLNYYQPPYTYVNQSVYKD